MTLHRCDQKGEFILIQVDVTRTDRQREPGGTRPVPGIMTVVLAAHVMQEGEILDHPAVRTGQARKLQPVAAHPRPMRGPMDTLPLEPEFPAQQLRRGLP